VPNANWALRSQTTSIACSDGADGSTADGTRESTGDPQKMGESAGTGEALA